MKQKTFNKYKLAVEIAELAKKMEIEERNPLIPANEQYITTINDAKKHKDFVYEATQILLKKIEEEGNENS